eukprot:9015796-Alexandrium_andersonii.AAC.1
MARCWLKAAQRHGQFQAVSSSFEKHQEFPSNAEKVRATSRSFKRPRATWCSFDLFKSLSSGLEKL